MLLYVAVSTIRYDVHFKETKQLQLCDENISIENVSRRNEIKASNKRS